MTMQIRRTVTPNLAPTGLESGQLAVEMASNTPRLWVGVPTAIDPTGRREIGGGWNGQVIGAQLVYESPTRLRLDRRNGGYIKVNGEILLIPENGFGIPNTGLDGSTTYYLFLDQAGQPHFAPRFGELQNPVPAAGVTHTPSVAPGNEGIQVMLDGTVQRPEYTLIGMVRTNGAGQFVDTPVVRWVRTWYGDRRVTVMGQTITASMTNYTGPDYAALGDFAQFLCWSAEPLWLAAVGFSDQVGSQGANYTNIMVGGIAVGKATFGYSFGDGVFVPHSPTVGGPVGEGTTYATTGALVSGGTGRYWSQVSGIIS